MIVFDLKCLENHQFEAWFKSSSAYEEQLKAGHVTCPFCGCAEIRKAPMAPNITAKSNQKTEVQKTTETSGNPIAPAAPAAAPNSVATAASNDDLGKMVAAAEEFISGVRKHVEDNFENVGNNFADEARKIHYGESEKRGIYGESTKEETLELIDEGIDVLPVPMAKKPDA